MENYESLPLLRVVDENLFQCFIGVDVNGTLNMSSLILVLETTIDNVTLIVLLLEVSL
jgi:hypothetical protein